MVLYEEIVRAKFAAGPGHKLELERLERGRKYGERILSLETSIRELEGRLQQLERMLTGLGHKYQPQVTSVTWSVSEPGMTVMLVRSRSWSWGWGSTRRTWPGCWRRWAPPPGRGTASPQSWGFTGSCSPLRRRGWGQRRPRCSESRWETPWQGRVTGPVPWLRIWRSPPPHTPGESRATSVRSPGRGRGPRRPSWTTMRPPSVTAGVVGISPGPGTSTTSETMCSLDSKLAILFV